MLPSAGRVLNLPPGSRLVNFEQKERAPGKGPKSNRYAKLQLTKYVTAVSHFTVCRWGLSSWRGVLKWQLYGGFCGFGIRLVGCLTVTFWNTNNSMDVWQRGRANLRLVVFCVGPDVVGPPEN
jgi:hypothetical protein